MPELLRMRVARSIQRRELPEETFTRTHPDNTSPFLELLSERPARALALLRRAQLLWRPWRLRPERITGLDAATVQRYRDVLDIDVWLNRRRDAPPLADLLAELERQVRDLDENALPENLPPRQVVTTWMAQHAAERIGIGDLLVATLLVESAAPQARAHVIRLVSIFGLLEALSGLLPDAVVNLAAVAPPLAPADIERILRARPVVFPPTVLDAREASTCRKCDFVVRMGVTDLHVLRTEWVRYVPGEIAHIENVIPGERKRRKLVQTDEREETTTSETITTNADRRDSQTTDRFEQQDEAERSTRLAVQVEGQVDTTGQYGPTKVDTHVGGNLDFSLEEATRRATTTARETVDRTITSVEQRVREERVLRTLTRTVQTDSHDINNAQGDRVAAIYRWVDKVQRYQLFRYPNRLLLEFLVPEPAAWIRWLRRWPPDKAGVGVDPPKAFQTGNPPHDITPADITRDTYVDLGARYGLTDLDSPPLPEIRSTASYSKDADDPRYQNGNTGTIDPSVKNHSSVRFAKLDPPIAVPDGYQASQFFVRYSAWGDDAWWGANHGFFPAIDLMVGNETVHLGANNDALAFFGQDGPAVNPLGPFNIRMVPGANAQPPLARIPGPTSIPVSVMTDNVRGYNIHLEVDLELTTDGLSQWQLETFGRLYDEYQAQLRRYNDALRAASIAQGIRIDGSNPVRSAEVVREELKKSVIGLLFGDAPNQSELPFRWPNLITRVPNEANGEPQVQVPDGDGGALATRIAGRAPLLLFLEEAFEWDKLTYVFYPYFWADKTSWQELARIAGPDAEYDKFLRAGAARVVVSARPGFEHQVRCFINHCRIWPGGKAPGPEETGYLSIADEIRAIHERATDGEHLESWEERLPTTLVWLQGDGELPVRPQADLELDPPPGNVQDEPAGGQGGGNNGRGAPGAPVLGGGGVPAGPIRAGL